MGPRGSPKSVLFHSCSILATKDEFKFVALEVWRSILAEMIDAEFEGKVFARKVEPSSPSNRGDDTLGKRMVAERRSRNLMIGLLELIQRAGVEELSQRKRINRKDGKDA